jgi:hypothetical protein
VICRGAEHGLIRTNGHDCQVAERGCCIQCDGAGALTATSTGLVVPRKTRRAGTVKSLRRASQLSLQYKACSRWNNPEMI